VTNEKGERIELGNATLQLLHSPKRSVRRTAFHQYYQQFAAHENTLAATLSGSILTDVYYAKARGLRERAGGRAVSRQRAGQRLRQPDRRRPQATCRPSTATTICAAAR
jgi:hypothetical protein